MTRISSLTFAALVLSLASVPAHAQLLGGGGGLGGAVGGGLGGAIGGAGSMGGMGGMGSMGTIGSATSQVETTTRTAASASGNTTGSQHVNARSGKVEANRSVTGNGAANLTSSALANTPATGARSVDGALSASGSATGSGSANAQLIGTDQVANGARAAAMRANGAVGEARSAASGAVSRANMAATNAAARGRETAANVAGRANGLSAAAQGSAQNSLSAAGSLGSSNLALAGSAASQVAGSAAVKPGMAITAPDGSRLGKVRQVVADSNGRVQGVVMRARNTDVTLPATNFAASGNGKSLISTMNGQQIENAAQGQVSGATR